jgi:SAM-dependent methyltransferase
MNKDDSKEWFQVWFDSPLYPLLYNHRDETEANFFLDHLVSHLQPKLDSSMLDLACGRGRHAIYLNKLGFDVTGVDLSSESIREASAFASNSLRFYEHDMRRLLSTNAYDYVFNLFTSFGYFRRKEENLNVVKNMAATVKPGGTIIIDFLNAGLLRHQGMVKESKTVGDTTFEITKEINSGRILKHITVNADGKTHEFEERVSLLGPEEFEAFFKASNLEVITLFGEYDLSPFSEKNSNRLIYEVRKP